MLVFPLTSPVLRTEGSVEGTWIPRFFPLTHLLRLSEPTRFPRSFTFFRSTANMRLSFLYSLSFTEARHRGTHAICGIGPPPIFLHSSVYSAGGSTLSLQGDNRSEIGVPVWVCVSMGGRPLAGLGPLYLRLRPFCKWFTLSFPPRTRNGSRPKLGGGFSGSGIILVNVLSSF